MPDDQMAVDNPVENLDTHVSHTGVSGDGSQDGGGDTMMIPIAIDPALLTLPSAPNGESSMGPGTKRSLPGLFITNAHKAIYHAKLLTQLTGEVEGNVVADNKLFCLKSS
jgi:hypothetical protein